MRHRFSALCGLIVLACASPVMAQTPLMNTLFQDHAVLQRERPIAVWGTANPGESVTVTLGRAHAKAAAGADGRWQVSLPAMKASGPYVLEAQSTSGAKETANDVLVGDVFLCSGQSNMELQVQYALNAYNAIHAANNDRVRLLTVARASSNAPLTALSHPVSWQPVTPTSLPDFSAVCYYFGDTLQKTVDVPIGLVNASWGGTKIQPWMSAAALHAVGGYDDALPLLSEYGKDPVAAARDFGKLWEDWWHTHAPASFGEDPWGTGKLKSSDWKTAPGPLVPWQQWNDPDLANHGTGMLWYRTHVKLTAEQAAQAATLGIGIADEVDQTWVNGIPIGNSSGGDPRTYKLPAGALVAGDNVIVVNDLNTWGPGGLYGAPETRALHLADGTTISLSGPWYYRPAPAMPDPPRAPWDETGGLTMLYNGMIAPLAPYGFRGALWYQGESNTGDPQTYAALLDGMMADWRSAFGFNLPFLIVQLPDWGPRLAGPSESGWAQLREAERKAVAADSNAALAVTIDVGDPMELHPANKEAVGARLARAARHLIYGEDINSGPVPVSAQRSGDAITATFSGIEGALIAYGADAPIGFELCGSAVSSCHYATTTLDKDHVILSGADAATATRVRYCWADSPVCTLSDASGLPAVPFEIPIQ